MFSTITTAPSTTMPKSSAPSDSRLAGILSQVQTDGREQQRERNGQRHDERAADIAEEQEQDDRHQDDAFGQVVQHGVGGVVDQIAAIEERNDLHAGRQDVIVQLLHFFVDRLQRGVGFGAFAQQHDAFHHIVVVDDLAVGAMNRLADLAQPDLRPLRHRGDVADRAAACRSGS